MANTCQFLLFLPAFFHIALGPLMGKPRRWISKNAGNTYSFRLMPMEGCASDEPQKMRLVHITPPNVRKKGVSVQLPADLERMVHYEEEESPPPTGNTGTGSNAGSDDLEYFPDDGYDYSQHLRPMGVAGGRFMSASNDSLLKAKEMAERGCIEGMTSEELSVMKALEKDDDEDETEEGELEDNFVDIAQTNTSGKVVPFNMTEVLWGRKMADNTGIFPLGGQLPPCVLQAMKERGFDPDAQSDIAFLDTGNFACCEERFFDVLDEYGDSDIGSGTEGACSNGKMMSTRDLPWLKKEEAIHGKKDAPLEALDDRQKRHIVDKALTRADMETPLDDDVEADEESDEKFDVETVISLRSNLYNHPGRIQYNSSPNRKPIVLQGKHKIPVDYVQDFLKRNSPSQAEKLVKALLNQPPAELEMMPTVVDSTRPKNESSEEKRQRKKLVKEAQALQRQMKKSKLRSVQ